MPAVGFIIPHTALISVVLPAPFGPRSANISPRFTSKFTLSRALKPLLYVFLIH